MQKQLLNAGIEYMMNHLKFFTCRLELIKATIINGNGNEKSADH